MEIMEKTKFMFKHDFQMTNLRRTSFRSSLIRVFTVCYSIYTILTRGGALVWWLGHRIPEREVGGSILTQVTVLCPWARHIYLPKVLVIPRKQWLCPNMTEKLFTGTLRIKSTNQPFWQNFRRFDLFAWILGRLQQSFMAPKNLGTLHDITEEQLVAYSMKLVRVYSLINSLCTFAWPYFSVHV